MHSIIPRSYSPAELKALEENYYGEELEVTYVLKLIVEHLMVEHPRMSPFALKPVTTDGFLSESWRFRHLEFERDAGGNILGFWVSSGGVRGVRFQRT